jgi:hypothetical protein
MEALRHCTHPLKFIHMPMSYHSQNRYIVVRVPGYGFRGPGFISWRYQIFLEVVGLERGPLSLVRITEELLERKVAAPV